MKLNALVVALVALACGTAYAVDTQILAVTFQRCITRLGCSPITRWNEAREASAPREIRVVATLENRDSRGEEFFLLTTTEFIVAPMDAYSTADFEKLKAGNEVSWAQLTKDDDMRAVVVRELHSGSVRSVRLRTINLQQLLNDSFSYSDGLWPWLVRVNATLVDRNGEVVSKGSGILEIAAAPRRNRKAAQH